AFKDEGSGMSDEVVERAFEPFFTTKGVGGGAGLGLSTVYGIVTQHGGEVSIDSTPGDGTRVRISLPANRAPGAATAVAADTTETDTVATAPCILVVEDEDAVRRMVCHSLRRAGYRVLEAEDGVVALERLAAEPDVDLVLSDVAMPRMDGHELARRLFVEDSTLPILLMSGHATDAGPGAAAAYGVLAKPFQRQDLLERVRAALEPRTGGTNTV
ncbi:MAG: response regulator, partial [Pseudomonadales bacterium]|nr:response regulator [Pseudomonadales bacterium]